MYKKINDLDSGEVEFRHGLGVVFVDVNGLKTANDTKGHNEGEPSFALGAHYDDAEMNIKKTMRIADSNMYENKAEYYGSHPNADRRTH